MQMIRTRRKAVLALLLLVPASSIGVLAGMVLFPDRPLGTLVFSASKAWLFLLPFVWHRFIDREPLSLSPVRRGGIGMGVLSGVVVSAVIVAAYLVLGDFLADKRLIRDRLGRVGLDVPAMYLAGTAYWILVNSVLEEYVWRWFCVRQCETLMRPVPAAMCSALFFTFHHIVAMQAFLPAAAVLLCALGIFAVAAMWSGMYIRYRSIWPCYISHAIADAGLFGIGAAILFKG